MTRDAASAPGGRTGTVRSVTVAATTRYQQLIDALLAQASERETALLLLCATSLARHWELLHPETMLDRGVLHVPRTATNGLDTSSPAGRSSCHRRSRRRFGTCGGRCTTSSA